MTSSVSLIKGANTALPDTTVTIEVSVGAGTGIDLTALLLTTTGKVRGDDDMVFFNNPAAEHGAVRHQGAGPGPEQVTVALPSLPATIDRVALTASVDAARPGATFADVADLRVRLRTDGQVIEFAPPPLTQGESAAVLVELYRRGPAWKVRAVGQGYANGLAGIATDFGVSVDDTPAASPSRAAVGPPAEPAPAPPAQPAPSAGLNMVKPPLGKISLDKGGRATIPMDKADRSVTVTATLEWDGGNSSRRAQGADLDLYALFVPAAAAVAPTQPQPPAAEPARRGLFKNRGTTGPSPVGNRQPSDGVVYYRNLGSLTSAPHIRLDGDAKAPGIETIHIARPDQHGYVLICAYSAVENGVGSFKSYGAKAVVTDGAGSTVTVPLYHDNPYAYWVAIALVDFTDPDGVAISHVERYSGDGVENRPMLFTDGTFEMDLGPEEFKG